MFERKSAQAIYILFIVFVGAFVSLVYAPQTQAAINQSFTYQGKILNKSTGAVITSSDASCIVTGDSNDTCDFRASLYTAVTGGTLVWQETKTDIEIDSNDGSFELVLDCSGTFSSCNQNGGPDFNTSALYIELEFAPLGASSFTEIFFPRKQLSSMPYAFNADTVDGVNITTTTATPEGSITGSVGDLALDTTNGSIYLKTSGNDTNTGWTVVGSSSGTALADLTDTTVSSPASGNILVWDGTDSWDNKALSGDLTIDNNGVVTLTNGTSTRTNLGLSIGTDVQAYDAQLADVAGLAVTDGNFIVGNGTNFVAESADTARISLGVGTTDSPTFTGLTLSGMTATRLLATDGTSGLTSVANLASWIAGTTNQITVTDDLDGTITLATPQDIHTAASPTFAGFTIDALSITDILDEDTMVSNSATALSTQQAIKAYVDSYDTLTELTDTAVGAQASGDILIWDGTDSWDNKALSGDIAINNAGLTTISANSVALTTDTTGNYVTSITNGFGIAGADGGSEGATLTLALDINGLTAGSVINDADEIAIYDVSATAIRKMTRANFLSGITGALVYQGSWNASTNTPTLADGTGSKGQYYVASAAGTQDLGSGNIIFTIGDWVIHNGGAWEKLDSTNDVQSVFGRMGIVVASSGDYTALKITNVAAGDIAATDVQTAINELDTEKQPLDTQLTDIAGLTPSDGYFIVGDGTNFIAESGNTARTSLGLGTGDSPTLTGLTLSENLAVDGGNITSTGALTITPATGALTVVLAGAAGDDFIVDTNVLVVESDNNRVGIGTASPNSALDLGELGTAVSTLTQANSGALDLTGSYWTGAAEAKHRFVFQNIASTTINEEGRLGISWDASELMSILSSGNIGIGTTSPYAKLQVTDGSVLFAGTTGSIPTTGAGTRLMWYPAKNALRAGSVNGSQWDDSNIGTDSVAFGYNTIASGNRAFAAGNANTASNLNTVALGKDNMASGNDAIAIGLYNASSDDNTYTFGRYLVADTNQTMTVGFGNSSGARLTNSTTNSVLIGAPTEVSLATNNTKRLTVDSSGNLGIGTATPGNLLHLAFDDAATNAVGDVFRIEKTTSGVAAAGLGAGLVWHIEDLGGSEEQASIDVALTNVTDLAEDSDIIFSLQKDGAMTEIARLVGDALALQLGNNAVAPGELRFTEDTDNGSNYVAFKAPATVTADTTWELPDGDGTGGQVLKTDGLGVLSWTTADATSYSEETANFTAAAGSAYLINTNDVAITVTLPDITTDGEKIVLIDKDGNAASNNITVNADASDTIENSSSFTIDLSNAVYTFIADLTDNRWTIQGDVEGTSTPLVYVQAKATADEDVGGTASTFYPIDFATESIDTHGAWATDTFTAPQAGRYRVTANISWTNNGGVSDDASRMQVRVNGSAVHEIVIDVSEQLDTDGWLEQTIDVILDISAGQTIQVGYTDAEDIMTVETGSGLNISQLPTAVITAQAQAAEYTLVGLGTKITGLATSTNVVFDTIEAQSGNISHSSGVFTLEAGKTYRLTSGLHISRGTTNFNGTYEWVDTGTGIALAGQVSAEAYSVGGASVNSGQNKAVAIHTPTSAQTVAVRFSALTQDTDIEANDSFALVELIADGTMVAQFGGATAGTAGTNGFVLAPDAGDQGALLLGNGTWSDPNTLFIDTSTNRLGLGTNTPTTVIEALIDSAVTNAIQDVLTLSSTSTGTVTAGLGSGLVFNVEDLGGIEEQGSIDVLLTDVTDASEDADMTFNLNRAGTITEAMRITSTGYVGIGTISPDNALHVYSTSVNVIKAERSSSSTNSSLRVLELHRRTTGTAASGIGAEMAFRIEDDGGGLETVATIQGILTDVSETSEEGALVFEVVSDSETVEAMRIQGVSGGSANIGIGNTNPGYLLQMEASGGGYYNESTNTWVDGSSIRYKENMVPITGALDIVDQLQGVYFNWNEEHGGAPSLGFIAEDVGQILPRIVDWDKEDPQYATGLDYGKITAILTVAIQEQQVQIENLAEAVEIESVGSADETYEMLALMGADLEGLEGQIVQLAERIATLEGDSLAETVPSGERLQSNSLNLSQFAELVQEGQVLQFTGGVEFLAGVVFHAPVTFSSDQVGALTIPAGATKVKVTFSVPFASPPVVSLTPTQAVQGLYSLEEVTEEGFVVSLLIASDIDLEFSWTAFLTVGDAAQVETLEEGVLPDVDALVSEVNSLDENDVAAESTSSAEIIILDSELGYVRVRQEPTIESEKIGQVTPGETYSYDEISPPSSEDYGEASWYHIEFSSGEEFSSQQGWISGNYVEVI